MSCVVSVKYPFQWVSGKIIFATLKWVFCPFMIFESLGKKYIVQSLRFPAKYEWIIPGDIMIEYCIIVANQFYFKYTARKKGRTKEVV